MKFYLLFILIFLNSFLYSQQKLKGVVLNTNKQHQQSALIQNLKTKETILTDKTGYFEIDANINDTLIIKSLGYSPLNLKVDSLLLDSKVHFFYLKDSSLLLNTVEVTSKNLKNVFNYKNENVLDFEFWNDFLLVLSKLKNNYYLSLIKNDVIKKKYQISFLKPKKLNIDCYENIHITSKSKTYQIYLDTTLHIIDSVSNDKYQLFLNSLVYCGESLISERLSHHNQKYLLLKFNQQEQKNEVLYTVWDKEAEKVAKKVYDEIIAYYYSVTDETSNIILNKSWDGDLLKLAENDTLVEKIGWYKNVRAKEINVQSFSVNNSVVSFNFFNDSIVVFNIDGKIIYTTKFSFLKTVNQPKIIRDMASHAFYIYYFGLNQLRIDKVNLHTGENKVVLKSLEVLNPKKILINDGWAYVQENTDYGYYKLYKLKLDDY